ncbi:hypothetical protein ACS0TY_031874 [Phlomoides rotata]
MVLEIKERSSSSPSQQSFSVFQPPPPPLSSSNSNQDFNMNRVSPNILLIIIILAVIVFISGLLHLLVRFLFRPPNRSPIEFDTISALEGQLQQLFHLHDCGVDQSFIDTLPLFNYDDIKGVKDPFDCAVCLSEFASEDKLRLLPKCSHAFHMNCIDTWLLSHSTCPICRASLVGDFPPNGLCSPVVRILESGSWRERVLERGDGSGTRSGVISDDDDDGEKSGEIETEDVSIKLGKYRSIDGENDGNGVIDSGPRRCFSMGSFAYVMNENSSLKVSITTSMKNQSCKKSSLRGNRLAISECGCDSRRELFNTNFEAFNVLEIQSDENDNKSIIQRDSFSVSKIWLRGRKDKENAARMESSRRAFSFRFPVATGESNTKNGGGRRSSVSEIEIKGNNLDCEGDHPSFGRRTLLWLMGRQNKVVNSSFPSNV